VREQARGERGAATLPFSFPLRRGERGGPPYAASSKHHATAAQRGRAGFRSRNPSSPNARPSARTPRNPSPVTPARRRSCRNRFTVAGSRSEGTWIPAWERKPRMWEESAKVWRRGRSAQAARRVWRIARPRARDSGVKAGSEGMGTPKRIRATVLAADYRLGRGRARTGFAQTGGRGELSGHGAFWRPGAKSGGGPEIDGLRIPQTKDSARQQQPHTNAGGAFRPESYVRNRGNRGILSGSFFF